MSVPEVRRLAWLNRLESPAWHARPNAGCRSLGALERRGRLHALVTQNIDGLHQPAGNWADIVIEVHGTMREVVCIEGQVITPRHLPVSLSRHRSAGE